MPVADLEAYEDIPGTYLFNRHRSRQGYHLNQCFMSLLKPENREKFLADERAYLEAWGNLTEAQIDAVLTRNWLGMVKLGGNIYYMAKLMGTDQQTFQFVAGAMTGATEEEYRNMMLAGGRPIEGNRSKSEWEKAGGDDG
ncbi:MAG: protocatechuate 4,5-dioxygenase subunit alpha [Gammaproteobacteria bacterium]|nr:protocatechuate 4,5-dioxygenase subunit alpha [Gammaproteobacteria bacterium]